MLGSLPPGRVFQVDPGGCIVGPSGYQTGGSHAGLSLVGRKKINLRAPKMELLKQKVAEALESCKEDSEEMASGFKRDAELHQPSPETQGGSNRNRKDVCSPRVGVLFDQERGKKQLKLGVDLYIGKINITEMLFSLFTRVWLVPYSGKIMLRLPQSFSRRVVITLLICIKVCVERFLSKGIT